MTFQSHAVYDNEAEIIRAGNTPCPADVDLKYWQRRIDQVAGKSATGQSHLRIIWGQDTEVARMIVCGDWKLKYPFWRVQDGSHLREIGIPRFIIEEHIPASELMVNGRWDNARYSWDAESGALIDVLGPLLDGGFYSKAFVVAHHDEMCCNGEEIVKGEPCLGAYRLPAETDIARIQRALQRREAASNSEVAPSPEYLEKQRLDMLEKQDERRKTNLRERLDDWTKTHAHTWTTDDPSVITHGKYHWMSGHSKSGTPKESNADSERSS